MIPEIENGLQNVTLGTVTALAQAIGTDVCAPLGAAHRRDVSVGRVATSAVALRLSLSGTMTAIQFRQFDEQVAESLAFSFVDGGAHRLGCGLIRVLFVHSRRTRVSPSWSSEEWVEATAP